MSTTYGTASSITIPSDGDTIDAADVNTPLAAIWDQHDALADLTALQAILVPTHGLVRYVRGYGHFMFVTSGTYSASTAASPWILTATDGTAGRWVLDLTAEANKSVSRSFAIADAKARGCIARAKSADFTTTGFWRWVTTDTAAADTSSSLYYAEGTELRFHDADNTAAVGRHLMIQLNEYLCEGATLNGCALVLGGMGHGALPAMMPAMGIVRYDHKAATLVSLKSGTAMVDDPTAVVATYDAIHEFSMTCDQNNVINMASGYVYYLIICNEGHTNALAELRLFRAILSMTSKGFF